MTTRSAARFINHQQQAAQTQKAKPAIVRKVTTNINLDYAGDYANEIIIFES